MISHRGRGKRLLNRLLCRRVTARANISLFIYFGEECWDGKGIDREVEAVGQDLSPKSISARVWGTSSRVRTMTEYHYYQRDSLSRKRVVLARILLLSGWQTGISPRAAD